MTRLEHVLWMVEQAYRAYRDSPGSWIHEDAPPWKELPAEEQTAWQVVAETLHGYLRGD